MENLEGIFLEIRNSLAHIIALFFLFILTFGFECKNTGLNSKNIDLQSPFGLLVMTYFSFETKCKANHKGRALYGLK